MATQRYRSAIALAITGGAAAVTHNDAGTGTDAPTYPLALAVPDGQFSGSILNAAGDVEDGFTVAMPPEGMWRHLRVTSADGATSVRLNSTGAGGGRITLGGILDIDLYVQGGDLSAWFGEDGHDVHYALTSEVVPPSDVSIRSIVAELPPPGLPANAGPKWASLTLVNQGEGRDPFVWILVDAQAGGTARWIAFTIESMEPMSTRTFRFPFDDTGMFGDVTLRAQIFPILDLSRDGWDASSSTYVIMPGAGADLFNQDVTTPLPTGHSLTLGMRYYGAYLGSQHVVFANLDDGEDDLGASVGRCGTSLCLGRGGSLWPTVPSSG